MATLLGSLNRSAQRATAQDLVDNPVVEKPVPDPTWSEPPNGYSRVFFDDFSQPSTKSNNWQGVDQDKWEVNSIDGNPNQSGASDTKWPFFGTNVLVKPGGGLYTYGGRRPPLAPGDNTIGDDERALSSISTQQKVVRPGVSAPRIIRVRTEWEQRYGYVYQPWSFSSWADATSGGSPTMEHGWEFDLETQGSEYNAGARTFKPHFNTHIWNRPKGNAGAMRSQQSPLKKDIQLPSNPRDPITIDLRWRRGSDFWDPYQTHVEWWVEEVVGGVATGNMVRQYHWSPRHFLEAVRNNGNWPKPSDAPPADPLPPELANVAPSNIWAPKNSLKNQSPYNSLGDLLFQPYVAAYDPSYTWWDVAKDSWVDRAAGGLIWWNGFAKEWFFLADSGTLNVSDYDDHHSHIDDEKCFSSVWWGAAVFDPD